MNFIVLGAGAVGCYVGGRLAAAGETVTFVGRPRSIDALATAGLHITDLDGFDARVAPAALRLATSLEQSFDALGTLGPVAGKAPVLLLCVKGGGTDAAAREIQAAYPGGITVLSLQNGVDNAQRISAVAPRLQVIAGMVPYNVVQREPGQVHRASSGRLRIGAHGASAAIAGVLCAAGLATEVSNDMRAVQWGKLLLNLNNPINALSDLPLRAQLMQRDYRLVLAALQLEALVALRAAGVAPAQIATLPAQILPKVLRLPDWLFRRVAARMLRIDTSARSSMWDDLQQGRSTEIDDLCGAVLRLALAHGTSAPCNQAITGLVATHQKGRRWSGAELRQALGV